MKTIIDDIKEILIFTGYSFRVFIINMVIHFFYIFLVTAVTVVMFFLDVKTIHNHIIFILYLLVLAGINYKVRSMLIMKNHLHLNLMFLHYLDGNKNRDFLQVKVPGNTSGIKRIKMFPNLSAARAAVQLKGVENPNPARNDIYIAITFLFLQAGIFLVLFIPFGVISFLYTIGMPVVIRFFTFLLGFFFVYFLDVSILSPIVSMMMTKRIYSTSNACGCN